MIVYALHTINTKYIALKAFSILCFFSILFTFQYWFYDPNEQLHELYPRAEQSKEDSVFVKKTNSALVDAISNRSTGDGLFPRIVHQTWKSTDIHEPKETIRWKKGCKLLNPDYDFRLTMDEEIKAFVYENYPEYVQLFKSLKGVYMADMARVLLVYHYGGIYLDLDFYCFRPFSCLEDYINRSIRASLSSSTSFNSSKFDGSNILVVSREPVLHAYMIHNKERIVIQDFYMATPRHPFLKWFLDRENFRFFQRNDTLQVRGPFSYNINQALDKFYTENEAEVKENETNESLLAVVPAVEHSLNETVDSSIVLQRALTQLDKWTEDGLRHLQVHFNANESSISLFNKVTRRKYLHRISPSGRSAQASMVFELPAHVLHPLVDSSNHKLREGCQRLRALESRNLQEKLAEDCRLYQRGETLFLHRDTMLVHMWTHTFIYDGFNALRGWWNAKTYKLVESTMPPAVECPA